MVRFYITLTLLREHLYLSLSKYYSILTVWIIYIRTYSGKNGIAFDVRLKDHVRNLATKGRVVFGTVDLNERKGYDPSTGIFTAPTIGIYVFDWTILTQQAKEVHTSLVVNGKFKSWSHWYDVGSKTWLSCSKMTIVKLKEGDKVWIGVFSGAANIYNNSRHFLVINFKENPS